MQFYSWILFPFLVPISWFYGCIIYVRNQFYNWGLIKTISFNKPIISIGNITSGGTGKTPLVIYFAKLLLKIGKKPGIISRGYGRKSQGLQIIHDGKISLSDVNISGDEPYLMARVLEKVPVVVCEDRSKGVRHLLKYYSVDVIIMDDGFQHRKVNRDLDIISVSANNKVVDYKLLPWGNLRESLKNIKRADLVIYTKTNNYKTPAITSKIQPFIKTKPIKSSIVSVLMKYDTSGCHNSLPPNKPMFAFCGIAEPNSFIKTALELGLNIEDRKFFRDHQDYTKAVIRKLSEQIRIGTRTHVVTTEKDLVKLPLSFLAEFDVYVIRIDVVFEDESIIQDIIKQIFLN